MTAENYILAILAGFVVGWVGNAISRSRFSFSTNLFVAIAGAILLNFFIRSSEMMNDDFFPTLGLSLFGSAALLLLFHLSRFPERARKKR
ncbi:transglycosylase [Asticcacaulis sp. EMRT-3]|uniref:transglycosylase n=1 Tax=Asticcacaulis sp. EMRT-3 TaxID=3040349 RepID=UPI0024AEC09D|nr:transglycosylase [Asticcacaulis sp. EMRT-3]MDI7774859.1 transglycosylase [Asticcacaulis sp. EMRT-3]